MTRSLLTIATAVFALGTMLASAAEAGFKVRLGFGGPVPFHHFSNDNYQPKTYRKQVRRKYQRRAVEKNYAAKTQAKKKVETVAKTETAQVEWENSSITSAKDDVARTEKAQETKEPVKTASVEEPKELGCKKFFPSVGMVLSVPCE